MHDFMKTILLAMKEWVNKKIKNNTPNWNENDPEADGYIKNKPFYTKKVSKILVDNVSIEITAEGNPSVNMLTLDNIIEGQTYNIIWDDIEYDCVSYIAEGPNAPSVGNGTLCGASGGNGEPFFITVFQGTSLLFAEVGTHRISITTNSVEVKKISKEYLPDIFEIPNSNLVNGTAYGSLRALGTIAESEDYILGEFAFAEGWETKAPGFAAHAEGVQSVAEGNGSHAEGCSQALGQHSHSEGSSKANGDNSHAEGSSEANGDHSHAEGFTVANGNYSHTEGCGTKTYGNYSHAEGFDSVAFGAYSHVGGRETFANGRSMVVIGEYNTGDRPDRYELSTTTITNYQIRNMRAMASSVAPTYSEDENRFIWEDYTKMEPSQALNQYYFISHTAYAYVTSCTIDNMSAYISGTLYRMEDLTEKRGDYVVVVGNGMGGSGGYSNAHTLSWDGTAWFQGDIYVNSTSGTNRDEGSKKLATEDFVTAALTALGLPVPTAADAGKILRVNAEGKYELVSIANAEEATF